MKSLLLEVSSTGIIRNLAGLSDCVPTKEPFASDIDGREQLIRLESAVPIFVPKLGCDALLIIGNRD